MTIEEPTPEQQRLLLESPEARTKRRARRIGERSLESIREGRGRKRPEIASPDKLQYYGVRSIASEVVTNLGESLRGRQPLLDQFTKHSLVNPTRASMDRYIMAANGKSTFDPSVPKVTRKMRLQRQSKYVADSLQQNSYDDRNIARLRRAGLRATQVLINKGEPLDESAARFAADAIQDFGHGLSANRGILREVHDEGLGERIAYIGEVAVDDPTILAENPLLLRLVQIEQKERVEFWDPVYRASRRFYGDLLDPMVKQDAFAIKDELARLDALCQS